MIIKFIVFGFADVMHGSAVSRLMRTFDTGLPKRREDFFITQWKSPSTEHTLQRTQKIDGELRLAWIRFVNIHMHSNIGNELGYVKKDEHFFL